MNLAACDLMLIGIRFLHFTTVMLLFGAAAFPLYTGVRTAGAKWLYPRLALVALISSFAWLDAETVSMSGDGSAWLSPHVISKVLQHTEFGRIWLWRMPVLILLTTLTTLERPRPRLFCITAGASVATLAGVGHGAMGNGFDAWLHLANQAVHMLSGAIWVGGLMALLQLISQRPEQKFLHVALQRFSLAGVAAILLIVATGVVNSWFLVGSIGALLGTVYGHVLLIKLLFFSVMIILALVNRMILMPRLEHDQEAPRLLIRSIAVEQALALLVIAAVSVLGMLTPAFDMAM